MLFVGDATERLVERKLGQFDHMLLHSDAPSAVPDPPSVLKYLADGPLVPIANLNRMLTRNLTC